MTDGAERDTSGRLFGLLRVAFDRAVADVTAQVGPRHPELRPAHLMLFRFGGIDGQHTTELAAHAGITKQSMHEMVTHLERHGYLRRATDPDRPRTRIVTLTAAGLRLERQVHHAIAAVLESWAAQVGRTRLDEMWATLSELTGEPLAPTDPETVRRGSVSGEGP